MNNNKITVSPNILKKHLEKIIKIPYAAKNNIKSAFFISFDSEKLNIFVDDGIVFLNSSLPVSKSLKIEGTGQFVVNAYIFNELIQSFNETIEIYLPEQQVVCLDSGSSKNQINLIDLEYWKEPIKDTEGMELELTTKIIKEISTQVAFAAEIKEGRDAYQGINFRTKNNHLFVSATDNQRIAYKKLIVINEKIDVILPVRAISEIYRQLTFEETKEKVKFIFGTTELLVKITSHKTIVARFINDNYPDVAAHLNKEFTTQITCEKIHLIQALGRISIVFEKEALSSTIFKIQNNQFSVSSPLNIHSGASEETISATITGVDQILHLRVKFLLQSIQSIQTKNIEIKFSANAGAIYIQAVGDDSLIHLILPFWEY